VDFSKRLSRVAAIATWGGIALALIGAVVLRQHHDSAYTLHFYAATHGQGLRDQATAAINMGAALFVTEWGTTPADGHGNPDTNATNTWMQFLKDNNISHANWGVSDEAVAGAAQLVRGASPSGNWTDAQLSASGRLAKGIIQGW